MASQPGPAHNRPKLAAENGETKPGFEPKPSINDFVDHPRNYLQRQLARVKNDFNKLFAGTSSFWVLAAFYSILTIVTFAISNSMAVIPPMFRDSLGLNVVMQVYLPVAAVWSIAVASMYIGVKLLVPDPNIAGGQVIGSAALSLLTLTANALSYRMPGYIETIYVVRKEEWHPIVNFFETQFFIGAFTVLAAVTIYSMCKLWKNIGNNPFGALLGCAGWVTGLVMLLRFLAI